MPWRNHSAIEVGLANAEIRTRESRARTLPLPPQSLKCKFDSWDSPSKLVPIQRNCADGASATETGATFRNGCFVWGIAVNPTFSW